MTNNFTNETILTLSLADITNFDEAFHSLDLYQQEVARTAILDYLAPYREDSLATGMASI